MKLVRSLESFFEKYIEGFFNKKFASGLQPVEIAKQLEKEMERQKSVGIKHIYVPNSYQVYMNSEEFTHFSPYSEAVCQELANYLTEEAFRKEYTIIGDPIVEIYLDNTIGQEKYHIASTFTKPIPVIPDEQVTEDHEVTGTRVFDKVITTTTSSFDADFEGLFTVVEGLDSGKKVDMITSRINIGRRQSNELPLADMNTSRLHAYVLYEEGGHVVYDAQSLNGTFVNGHRITRKQLKTGDRVKVGNTIILYEVK